MLGRTWRITITSDGFGGTSLEDMASLDLKIRFEHGLLLIWRGCKVNMASRGLRNKCFEYDLPKDWQLGEETSLECKCK